MAKLPPFPGTSGRRDWRTALDAIGKLMANGDDTTQVFRIMRALNVGNAARNYARLLATEQGGRIAYDRVELAPRFSDPAYVARFAPGTVGAAYRDFLAETGYSADGLVEVSKVAPSLDGMPHPYAWLGRRVRDCHDIWHVLTGYKADESLGEASLAAFSFAQVGGLGWALIASAAAAKSVRVTGTALFAKAVWEGYRNGRHARWISGEDYLQLLDEPIDVARARLGIREPVAYLRAQRELGAELASYLSAPKAVKPLPI
ncbi:ubiquinone biosynthesis protein [Sphingomonas ginsenosidivorax]|uniref:Ubiquinone biosynthesis protein n=1 Tax=Sphingomonas ginsenosidivorax TaxID=862135 RepID=A0A5C6ULY7_9SPHN|nr:Coq4 family protein [Sphingomonas ginsenosidivorax]TXC72415.1 ubiquinone biosynthesis protein [Sphingomonas ginsenosidivorax]